MPGPNELELEIGTAQAEASIERLRTKIQALRAELTTLGNAIGSGGGSPAERAQFRTGVAQLAGAESALNVLQGSAQAGTSGGATTASELAAAAMEGAAPYLPQARLRNVPFGDPAAAFAGIQAMLPGLSTAAQYQIGNAINGGMPVSPNIAQQVVSLVQTAQVAATALGQRTAALPIGPDGSNGPFTRTMLMGPGGASPGLDPTMMLPAAYYRQMTDQAYPDIAGGQASPYLRAGAAGMAVPAYSALSLSTQEGVSGRPDLMGRAALPGQIIGGLMGALTGNPYVAAGAAVAGGQITQWLMAPSIREQQTKESLFPMQGFFGGDLVGRERWAERVAASVTAGGVNWRTMSPQAVGAMGSTVAFGMWMGGGDPFASSWYGGALGTAPAPMAPTPPHLTGRLLDDLPAVAGYGIRSRQYDKQLRDWRAAGGEGIPAGPEEAWQAVTRRVAQLYPNEQTAQSVVNRIAPIYGSRPETGDNPADILMRFGPQAAYEYYQSQVEPILLRRGPGLATGGGRSFMDPNGNPWRSSNYEDEYGSGLTEVSREQLRNMSVAVRTLGRRSTMAGTLARGGPRQQQLIAEEEMSVLASLPGGSASLAYAEAGVRRRDAVQGAFAEYAGAAFELPLMRMEGALERARMMPFAPGYAFGMGLEAAQMRSRYLGALGTYRETRRRSGELSVGEDLSIEQQMQGLLSANQATIAMMSEGGPNLMASLSTGGPAGFGRFDAAQMAALRVRGTPIRRFGAMGGAQSHQQEAFLQSAGFGGMGPMSPTGALSPDGGQVVSLLRQILEEMRRGGGSFPVRSRGPADLAPSGGYVQTGANAPFN